MNTEHQNKKLAVGGRFVLIKRVVPFALLIVIYILLVTRPLFVASGYSNSTSPNTGAEGIFRDASKRNLNWLAPDDQDLSILKSHIGSFEIGQSGIYLIDVINIGDETITGPITVTDNLPVGLTPSQVEGQGWEPCDFSGQLVTCVYSNTAGFPSTSSLPVVNLTVTVDERAAPEVTNFAVVENDNDEDSGNNIADDLTVIVSADLEVSKTATPSVVDEGDEVTFTISVVNNGPSPTSGVVLTDTLPGGLTYSANDTSKGTYNPISGLWSVGDLTSGEIAILTLTTTVDSGTRGETIVNLTEGVQSDLYDYDESNNTAIAIIRVSSTRLIGLVTDAATDHPIISAGLVLTDSVNHVYTTTTSASGWYTFTDSVSTPLVPGDITIEANKEGYAPSTVASNLAEGGDTRLDFQLDTADLSVTKTDGSTTVIPGQTITYTIAITNVGSIAASNVVITDVIGDYLTFITDTLDIEHSEPTTNTLVWTLLDDLEPNEGISFEMGVQVAEALPSSSTQLANDVQVSTSSPEANLTNNSAQDVNTSTGSPIVSFTKSVSPSQVRTGQSVTYRIRVNNTGTAPATDLEITDTFSLFLNLTSVSTTKGTATTNSTTRKVTVEIDVLNPGETVTVTVVGRVNSAATYNRYVSNRADLSYLFGGSTITKVSNSVSFQILATSTLPGTGGIEPLNPIDFQVAKLLLPALLSGLVLGLLGLFALVYGFRARSRQHSEWASWYLKMGLILSITALTFGFSAFGLMSLSTDESTGALLKITKLPVASKMLSTDPVNFIPAQAPVLLSDDPENLPDYPIPTPAILIAPDVDEKQLDTSPVEWILIPGLGIDTIVKYVPYDGLTWLIEGLKHEVAWMGDTSWPGLSGNVALAGHVTLRDGGNGPFRHLNQLDNNDAINLYTQENIYTYQVRDKRIVEETDMSVLDSGEKPTLTLITCTDWDAMTGFYRKRLIVFADLINVEPLRIEARGN